MSNQESPTVHFFPAVLARAAFGPDKMQKLDCFQTPRLFVGLNSFEPGQSQRIHAHEGADKFYLVLSGKASVTVGDETRVVGAGDLVLAPAGAPHGVPMAHERTVMLVGITKQAV